MKILILGVSGMLGSTIFRYFLSLKNYEVKGTVRDTSAKKLFNLNERSFIVPGYSVYDENVFHQLFNDYRPDIVINCIGLIKQISSSNDPLIALPINALFPHQIFNLCKEFESKLIHMSTDCVFDGKIGMYTEACKPDADDLYGISKRLGEIYYPNSITLRTSIIGHEINSNKSLVDWFLSQEGVVKGYKNAIFSGLPTIEIAKIIEKYIIPNPELFGLYHLSAEPINKYDLLNLIKDIYEKKIHIVEDIDIKIDRSLDSSKFRNDFGFSPLPWIDLIKEMKKFG